jgi:gliding motility-associated-like protein
MKVQKCSGITSFGGINFVLEELDALGVGSLLDDHLSTFGKQSKYQWKDILYSFWSVLLCGGDELPEGTSVQYLHNVHTDVGHYVVRAIISGGNYVTKELEAAMLIDAAPIYSLQLPQQVFVYDGQPKSLTLSGKLPTGSTVTFEGNNQTQAGSYKVIATIIGANYVTQTLQSDMIIEKAELPEIQFPSRSFIYDGSSKSLVIEGSLPTEVQVTYHFNSRTQVGTQEVVATIQGKNYKTRELRANLTITPANRQLTFDPLPIKTFGDAPFDLHAKVQPTETIRYFSSNPEVAEIQGSTLRIVGAGTATITAQLEESPTHGGSLQLTQVLTVVKASQRITFSGPDPLELQAKSIPLNVQSNASLPVQLSVDQPLIASLEGTTLHLHAVGTVHVTATQSGDANYEAAEPVTVRIQVIHSKPTIDVKIHQALSPNGDGINEYFRIEGIQSYPDNRLIILSTSGQILYDKKGYNNSSVSFKGITNKGQKAVSGTYYYLLEINHQGKTETRKGYLVLKN